MDDSATAASQLNPGSKWELQAPDGNPKRELRVYQLGREGSE